VWLGLALQIPSCSALTCGPVRSASNPRVMIGRMIEVDDFLYFVDPPAPPRGTPEPEDADLPLARTQGGVLMHVYEELAQHRGQMEVTSDVLRAPWAGSSGSAGG
jgi:hypothetical protein